MIIILPSQISTILFSNIKSLLYCHTTWISYCHIKLISYCHHIIILPYQIIFILPNQIFIIYRHIIPLLYIYISLPFFPYFPTYLDPAPRKLSIRKNIFWVEFYAWGGIRTQNIIPATHFKKALVLLSNFPQKCRKNFNILVLS